jgi:hypothetical protein
MAGVLVETVLDSSKHGALLWSLWRAAKKKKDWHFGMQS